MATGATSAAAAAFLKRYYTPKFVINTVSKKASRLFREIVHNTDGSGDSYNFLSVVGDNPSGSATFSSAQTTGQTQMSLAAQFKVDWCNDFETPTVAGDLIAKSRNKVGGWIPHLKHEMDSALRYAAHRKSVALFTSGFGELATVTDTIGAGTTITVGNPRTAAVDKSCIYRFVKGMKLNFSASISGNTLRTGTCIVTKVNYATGVLTVDTALNAITGLTQNDVIFTDGDRQNSATPSRLRPAGLAAWCPVTAPSGGESFFGVDRTTNSFLFGWIVDQTTKNIVQAFVEACQTVSSVGNAEKMLAVTSPANFSVIALALQGQTRYDTKPRSGDMAFEGLTIFADGLRCDLISDKYCVDSESYVLDPSAMHHTSIGEAPQIANDDGQQVLRQTADDGVEVRVRSYECYSLENAAAAAVIKHA